MSGDDHNKVPVLELEYQESSGGDSYGSIRISSNFVPQKDVEYTISESDSVDISIDALKKKKRPIVWPLGEEEDN